MNGGWIIELYIFVQLRGDLFTLNVRQADRIVKPVIGGDLWSQTFHFDRWPRTFFTEPLQWCRLSLLLAKQEHL